MIHIGKLILQQVHQQGICKSELARRLNVSPQNVYNLFKRKTVQASLLKRVSIALKFDFFNVYDQLENGSLHGMQVLDSNANCFAEYRELVMEANRLREENDYLKVLIQLRSKELTNSNNTKTGTLKKATSYTLQKTSIS